MISVPPRETPRRLTTLPLSTLSIAESPIRMPTLWCAGLLNTELNFKSSSLESPHSVVPGCWVTTVPSPVFLLFLLPVLVTRVPSPKKTVSYHTLKSVLNSSASPMPRRVLVCFASKMILNADWVRSLSDCRTRS
uniref:Uncharacterized protein n=1 Tax=Cacopsylla melanoneura TaxID=428564 RepID=A0A8D8UA65_9HEMI